MSPKATHAWHKAVPYAYEQCDSCGWRRVAVDVELGVAFAAYWRPGSVEMTIFAAKKPPDCR